MKLKQVSGISLGDTAGPGLIEERFVETRTMAKAWLVRNDALKKETKHLQNVTLNSIQGLLTPENPSPLAQTCACHRACQY